MAIQIRKVNDNVVVLQNFQQPDYKEKLFYTNDKIDFFAHFEPLSSEEIRVATSYLRSLNPYKAIKHIDLYVFQLEIQD